MSALGLPPGRSIVYTTRRLLSMWHKWEPFLDSQDITFVSLIDRVLLMMLCKQDVAFLWTMAYQWTFDRVRESSMEIPMFHYVSQGKDFILDIHASHHAIGVVLSQVDEEGREILCICIQDTMHNQAMILHNKAGAICHYILHAVFPGEHSWLKGGHQDWSYSNKESDAFYLWWCLIP